ncbi:MAG: phospholipid-binding protein MlaC [Nitrospinales bacterium]
MKSLLEVIKKIKNGNDLSAEQKKINQKYSALAITKLNIPGVGRRTLGKYWKQRTPQEQRDFLALLSKLFQEVAFPNSGKFFADLQITYGKSRIKKDRAIVPVTVVHKDEGEVDIDFSLAKVNGKWLVVEVVLDGVSMRNNLRSQFYKVIHKNSYQELIRRMNKKLKKVEAEG